MEVGGGESTCRVVDWLRQQRGVKSSGKLASLISAVMHWHHLVVIKSNKSFSQLKLHKKICLNHTWCISYFGSLVQYDVLHTYLLQFPHVDQFFLDSSTSVMIYRQTATKKPTAQEKPHIT